jgi:hypothetical protein
MSESWKAAQAPRQMETRAMRFERHETETEILNRVTELSLKGFDFDANNEIGDNGVGFYPVIRAFKGDEYIRIAFFRMTAKTFEKRTQAYNHAQGIIGEGVAIAKAVKNKTEKAVSALVCGADTEFNAMRENLVSIAKPENRDAMAEICSDFRRNGFYQARYNILLMVHQGKF